MDGRQRHGGAAGGGVNGLAPRASHRPLLGAIRRDLRWRTLEWWGAGIALFCFTGALVPLFSARRRARRLGALQAAPPRAARLRRRHRLPRALPRQLLVTVRRNLPFTLLLLLPFVSVLWSISGSITLRRAIGLLFSVALAYLLAIRFTPRQLAALVARSSCR